jgi:hypothetical protein
MRFLIRPAVACIVALGSALTCHSQCVRVEAHLLHCGGPNNWSQDVAVNIPYGDPDGGFYVSFFYVWCCETQFESYYETAPCTQHGSIPKAALVELASVQPLMIRNCAGEYDPFQKQQPEIQFDMKRSLDTHRRIVLN